MLPDKVLQILRFGPQGGEVDAFVFSLCHWNIWYGAQPVSFRAVCIKQQCENINTKQTNHTNPHIIWPTVVDLKIGRRRKLCFVTHSPGCSPPPPPPPPASTFPDTTDGCFKLLLGSSSCKVQGSPMRASLRTTLLPFAEPIGSLHTTHNIVNTYQRHPSNIHYN